MGLRHIGGDIEGSAENELDQVAESEGKTRKR